MFLKFSIKKYRIFAICFFLLSGCFSAAMGQCVPTPGVEAVKNGGFENGNDGTSAFGPHLNFEGSGLPYSSPGYYDIHLSPKHFNFGFTSDFLPHSGTKMLMVDAIFQAQAIFWEQTVSILPGQLYYFSAWLSSLSNGVASKLRFEVKGNNDLNWTILGTEVPAPGVGVWQQVFQTWNAGTNTSAMLRLSDYNPTSYSAYGNDFAVDDISFINSCTLVNNGPKPVLTPSTISLCNNGGNITLDTKLTGAAPTKISWYKDNGILTNTSPVLSNVTQTGNYTVCVDSNTCLNQATVNVVANLTIDIGPNTTLCSPATKTLQTGITVPGNFNIIWKKDGVVITDSSGKTSFVASEKGVYTVDVTDKSGGPCNASGSVTITSNLPVPGNFSFCPATAPNQTYAASGSGTYTWWTAPVGGTKVSTGNSYNARGLSVSTTYYVQDETTSPASAGLPDTSSLAGAARGYNNIGAQNMIHFTAKANSVLNTVSVLMQFNNAATPSVLVSLTDNTSSLVQTKNIPISNPGNGSFFVPAQLGFNLISGDNYTLTAVGNDGACQTFRYASKITYPMVYGPLTLTSGQSPGDMAGIFNWKLSLPNTCARMPVTGTAKCPLNCVLPTGASLSPAGPFNSCAGVAINQVLTASISNPGAATFQYEFFRNGVSVQTAAAATSYTATQPGLYTVSVTDKADPANCQAKSNVVSFKANFKPIIMGAAAICQNDSSRLSIKDTAGIISYLWTPGAKTPAQLYVKTAGSYTVQVKDKSGCNSLISDPFVLTKTPSPNAEIGLDTLTVCAASGTTLGTASDPAGTYEWRSVPPGFSSTEANPAASPLVPTLYIRTTKNGTCKAIDSLSLKIFPPSSLFLPNAFTPNNDNLNETFEIKLTGINTFNCGIYNRWGELIYEWNDPAKSWDGTLMNRLVHDDVYVYNLKYKEKCSNSSQVRTGIVTVMGK